MQIGIPKEIKNNENRVALPPSYVEDLSRRGHNVVVETEAGQGKAQRQLETQAAARVAGHARPAALSACEEIVASGPQRGAAGAQLPECTLSCMRIASTAQAPIRHAQ